MKLSFSGVDRLEHLLSFHRERHAVLSGNLANLDTPDYQPRDIEPPPRAAAAPAGIARAHSAHQAASGVSRAYRVIEAQGPTGADGNGVSLERELAKMDANRIRYSALAEIVSRRMALMRYAATDGNG